MNLKKITIALLGAAAGLMAQSATVKEMKPKSNKEVEAIQAVFGAQDPDTRIAAVENLLTKFADTQFKALALYFATVSAEQKNDFEKLMIYGERTLEADPKNYGAMLSMARALATRTREFDLDKEEKLGRAEKLATEAISLIAGAPKPRPDLSDEQWDGAKKDFAAQGHEALGLAAMVRKKYDVAASELKQAIDGQGQKDPATMVRLASVLADSGKYDEAIAVVDQINAMPDVPPQVKSIAGQTKMKAAMAKQKK
jgi:predicted negative regulator of RcsB-dependent stress response